MGLVKQEKTEKNTEPARDMAADKDTAGRQQEEKQPAENQADGKWQGQDNFIYIGPPLGTGIKENAVFSGTRESVETCLKGTFEKYPQAKMLLIPTKKLAEAKMQVRSKGTLLNKYYTDVLSLSKGRGQEGVV